MILSSIGRPIQCAVADAYERQDHGHFNCDRQHAECRANRPVGKIGESELVSQIMLGESNRTKNEKYTLKKTSGQPKEQRWVRDTEVKVEEFLFLWHSS